MASKVEKTIARLRQRIQEGSYYEAHQQLRVVASRYSKSANWDAAINILYTGAQDLLKAGQGASGGDLGILLVDIYKQGEVKPDGESKARIYQLLSSIDQEEPSRKRMISDAIAWTQKFGEFPAGDPEMHHFVGTLYAQSSEPYDAERHLLLGTKDSCVTLTNLMFEWYLQDDAHTAAIYAARPMFGYLLQGNVRDSCKAVDTFCSRLLEDGTGKSKPPVQSVETTTMDVRIFPSLPLMNFLRLVCLGVQRGEPGAELYRQLRSHYSKHITDAGGDWDEALDQIGEMYFNIKIHRPRNIFSDMVGSLFGGAPPAAPSSAKRVGGSAAAREPVAENLD